MLLTGCGNAVTRPPDTRVPDAPAGTRVVILPATGIKFTAPFNWPNLSSLDPAMVAGIQNKRATVAIWRYARTEPLPATRTALKEVRGLLLERVKRRDPTFQLDKSAYPRRDGEPSIELLGSQTIAGLRFRVRSAHVFAFGAEFVIDAFAPPEHFERVDKTVFRPLLKSLRFTKPKPAKTPTPTPTGSPTPTATGSPSPTATGSPSPAASPTPAP